MKAKILIAEDDESLISFMEPMLSRAGFQVIIARNGMEALTLVDLEGPDLVVLDVQMPEMDGVDRTDFGWDICRQIRQRKHYIPIIMLTVLDETMHKIYGLSLGADHYFTKPFDIHELIAQIEATLRTVRASQGTGQPNRLVFDDLEIDLDRWKVSQAGQAIELTPTEFKLLRFLAKHPGQVFGRETLLDEVWGYEEMEIDSNTVNKNIAELRRKLEPDPRNPQFILTVHGVGYKFREKDRG